MIDKITQAKRCDVCGLLLTFSKINLKRVFSKQVYICENCQKALYEELAKNYTPKCINAPYSPKRIKN